MESLSSNTCKKYYIASCLFTARFPQISLKIQKYIESKPELTTVRCCLKNFRIKQNTDRITDETVRAAWADLPPSADFKPGDIAYSLCHNCTNIVEEPNPGVFGLSLWEYIDNDPSFKFPDYSGLKVTVQDCWRTRDRYLEQEAVRSLLQKMNIKFVEAKANHAATQFCGSTLYREQPKKNAIFAPKHYVEQAVGKFLPHSEEEQIAIMKEYCSQFTTKTVVCYCHYCLEGLIQGGVNGVHLAHLLFAKN